MNWPHHQFARKDGIPSYNYPSPPPPSSPPGEKISPAVLFIAVILAVLFFISALLHLLVRLLSKRRNSSSGNDVDYPEISSDDMLQRQLHHLFNLHDSGLDQAFIDALPMFSYEEIMGPKEPFDCAVCLCEFSDKDKLRLLPTCSHAFHIACIDTWLLSNSTCPLCRAALYPDGTQLDNPIFESDEFHPCEEDEFGENGLASVHKKMAEIRLGKFRKLNVVEEIEESRVSDEASNSNLDARRCYSMGSYQYVVRDANLRVAFCPNQKKPKSKNVVIDEEQSNGVCRSSVDGGDFEFEGKKISSVSRGDSYSVSKIWLWQKKGGLPSSSRETRIDLSSLGTTMYPWIERSSNP